VVYIDDLMIFTNTDDQEKHDRIVLEVLKRLHDNDLFVKPEKWDNPKGKQPKELPHVKTLRGNRMQAS